MKYVVICGVCAVANVPFIALGVYNLAHGQSIGLIGLIANTAAFCFCAYFTVNTYKNYKEIKRLEAEHRNHVEDLFR